MQMDMIKDIVYIDCRMIKMDMIKDIVYIDYRIIKMDMIKDIVYIDYRIIKMDMIKDIVYIDYRITKMDMIKDKVSLLFKSRLQLKAKRLVYVSFYCYLGYKANSVFVFCISEYLHLLCLQSILLKQDTMLQVLFKEKSE